MNCPDCGAPMRLEQDKEFLICDFCGNIHFPDPNDEGVRVLGEPASEHCPVCKIPLVHAALSGLRLLYCTHCRGMLVSMDLFVVMVQDLRSRRDTSSQLAHPRNPKDLERHIDCPRCGQPMDTHPYGGPGNVVIDNCEHCGLNWLDHSELERIVRAPDRVYDESV